MLALVCMKTGDNKVDIGAVEDHGGILTVRGGSGATRFEWRPLQTGHARTSEPKACSANIAMILTGFGAEFSS
jgi:hypothetical protein